MVWCGKLLSKRRRSVISGKIQVEPQVHLCFSCRLRNTEIGGILGRAQLKRLDEVVLRRTENQRQFLSSINTDAYQTDFLEDGSSNYAFNLVLKNSDDELMGRLCAALDANGVEYRRGSAGGGNQLRQPYLKAYFGKDRGTEFPVTDHIHFYGCILAISQICPRPRFRRSSISSILRYDVKMGGHYPSWRLGTRLRSVVNDRPKPMAEVQNEPFLAHLMRYHVRRGAEHFVLSIGYRARRSVTSLVTNLTVFLSAMRLKKSWVGGALINSVSHLRAKTLPLMNGDTFFLWFEQLRNFFPLVLIFRWLFDAQRPIVRCRGI